MRISSIVLFLLLGMSMNSCDYDGFTIFRVVNASAENLNVSYETQGQMFTVNVAPGETDTLVAILDLVPIRDLGESFLLDVGISDLRIEVVGGQDSLQIDPQLRQNWVYMANAENMFRKAGDDVFSFEVLPEDIF